MTTKDEALRMALEALEPVSTYGRAGSRDTDTAKAQQAITAIREALAQPAGERGELLKLVQDVRRTGVDNPDTQDALDVLEAALLSSDAQPSEWVGLSDEERMAIPPMHGNGGQLAYAEAIEAKLREKNAGQPAAGECGNTSCAPGYCYCAEDKAGGDEPVAIVVHAPTAAGFPDGETFKVLWLSSPSSFPHGTKLYPRPQPQADVPEVGFGNMKGDKK